MGVHIPLPLSLDLPHFLSSIFLCNKSLAWYFAQRGSTTQQFMSYLWDDPPSANLHLLQGCHASGFDENAPCKTEKLLIYLWSTNLLGICLLFFESKQKIYIYSEINYQETAAFELEVLKLKGDHGLTRKVGIFWAKPNALCSQVVGGTRRPTNCIQRRFSHHLPLSDILPPRADRAEWNSHSLKTWHLVPESADFLSYEDMAFLEFSWDWCPNFYQSLQKAPKNTRESLTTY